MRNQTTQFTHTPQTEPELYARAIDHLQAACNCFRGLAQMRKDMRWLMVVRAMDEMIDRVRRLMSRGGPRLLWMPPRNDG